MKRQFFYVAAISCAAMAVLALLTPTASASTGRTFGPGSASAGAAVAAGVVTSDSGAAMPDATVELYAWPSDAVQQALRPGQSVPTTLLATATTNSAGRYRLMVPAAKLKAAAVESGYANLEIFSAVGGIWFLSYQTGSLPARPSAPVTVNLGGKQKPPSCGLTPQHRNYFFTGFIKHRQLNPAWAVIGQGYVVPDGRKTKGDRMVFNYTQAKTKSQTSTLGLGISGYGVDAGYNRSGTNTSTAVDGQGYPAETRNTWFRTEFNVGQFRGICYGPANDSNIPYQHQHGTCPHTIKDKQGATHYVHKCFWMVKSTGWFGGSGSVQHPKQSPRTPGKFCGPELRGGTVPTANQEAVQWSSGFTIGASDKIKDVTLKASFGSSSLTGYDANAQMVFTFGHAGWICGTNHDPASASQLVMRSNRA